VRHRTIVAAVVLIVALLGAPAAARRHGNQAQQPRAGQFDYYVLSLSWSPEHCASPDRSASDPQCAYGRYGFVVHGLWPQHERGFPESCAAQSTLGQSVVDGMLDIMPSPVLIRHEWSKHGTCSGMPPAAHFAKVRAAYAAVQIPAPYQDPPAARRVDTNRLRQEFLQANPGLDGNHLAVLCTKRYLEEVRICLDKQLRPRRARSLSRRSRGATGALTVGSARKTGAHSVCSLCLAVLRPVQRLTAQEFT
jgi:ribonuclease T2